MHKAKAKSYRIIKQKSSQTPTLDNEKRNSQTSHHEMKWENVISHPLWHKERQEDRLSIIGNTLYLVYLYNLLFVFYDIWIQTEF